MSEVDQSIAGKKDCTLASAVEDVVVPKRPKLESPSPQPDGVEVEDTGVASQCTIEGNIEPDDATILISFKFPTRESDGDRDDEEHASLKNLEKEASDKAQAEEVQRAAELAKREAEMRSELIRQAQALPPIPGLEDPVDRVRYEYFIATEKQKSLEESMKLVTSLSPGQPPKVATPQGTQPLPLPPVAQVQPVARADPLRVRARLAEHSDRMENMDAFMASIFSGPLSTPVPQSTAQPVPEAQHEVTVTTSPRTLRETASQSTEEDESMDT